MHSPQLPTGTVAACLIADGGDFVSRPVERLALDFGGIVGDFHAGFTRPSTSREPWYPRGTEIRNDRQLTIVSEEELAAVAAAMALPAIEPAWIGANLFFAGGVTIAVEDENGPCRTAGASIARHFPEREGIDLLFPQKARHRRGLVASVEKPGVIRAGETFSLRPLRAPAS
jgi:MOSC domain-containing protein YiiM